MVPQRIELRGQGGDHTLIFDVLLEDLDGYRLVLKLDVGAQSTQIPPLGSYV